jgi:hypothetical protein
MNDSSDFSSTPVGKYISPAELEEISTEIGLDEHDLVVMSEILEQWQPSYDLDYLVEVVNQMKGYLRSEKISAAAFAIAIRATTNYRQAGN